MVELRARILRGGEVPRAVGREDVVYQAAARVYAVRIEAGVGLTGGTDIGDEEAVARSGLVAVQDQHRKRRTARGAARPQRERPLRRPILPETVGVGGQGGVTVERERGRPLAMVHGVEDGRAIVEAQVRLARGVAVTRRRRDVLGAASLERPQSHRTGIVTPVDRRLAAPGWWGGGSRRVAPGWRGGGSRRAALGWRGGG